MNYLRELLYRPKRTDNSLLARFYYADEALTAVASELDSFDGRKDPERCSCLVNKLRSCQDKLLTICSEMLEQLEPGHAKKAREFRAKFPDDIITDNLAGQLWFGAECLAAGSSIMHKESESEQMRPLAKAVTKSLETVRKLLREQCLTQTPEYTENVKEHLKIFDRMFADFEYNYVCCMVHVKSVKEYEIHQDLIILFSDTLIRAIKEGMITQDMVDECDPSLMFAIPRLAIVYGLLICPEGPLNVDRSSCDFPDLFLPFKNLLRKIRELLQTLNASEITVLEMLLCQLEEPANISTKLKEVDRMFANKEKAEEGIAQAKKLQAKLDSPTTSKETPIQAGSSKPTSTSNSSQTIQRLNSIPCQCEGATSTSDCDIQSSDAHYVASALLDEVLTAVFQELNLADSGSATESTPKSRRPRPADIEIDCTQPEIEIRVSPQRREVSRQARSSEGTSHTHRSNRGQEMKSETEPTSSHHHMRRSSLRLSSSVSSPSLSSTLPQRPDTFRVSSSSTSVVLKRRNARRDPKRVPYKYHKDRRAKFKSTEDLLHRLYVCISGAADQLQSNYAGDFRAILRAVFVMNATCDEVDSVSGDASECDSQNDASNVGAAAAKAIAVDIPSPAEQVIPPVDLGTDALHHEFGRELYDQHLRQTGQRYDELSNDDERFEEHSSGEDQRHAYGQNLGLHAVTEDQLVHEFSIQPSGEFFQTEPALLDIASGSANEDIPEIATEEQSPDEVYEDIIVRRPPPWVPDSMAPNCFGCANSFTVIRRRHHCRACGGVFCGRCSSHSVALPHYGLPHPVRVCNRCHLVLEPVQASLSNTLSPTPTSPWSRTFGMVS